MAIVGADAEFGKTATDGARENAKAAGLSIVYDQRYPPSTMDFSPIVRAIQATNPDIVFIASYPTDSVNMIRAINEVGLEPKMIGGALIGLLVNNLKMQLGPRSNGFVQNEVFVPGPTFNFPGVQELLKKYQAQAPASTSIPWATASRPWPMPRPRSWPMRSRRPRASTNRSSPTTSARTASTRSMGHVAFGDGWRMGEAAPRLLPVPELDGPRPRPVPRQTHQVILCAAGI